ncbi:LysM peptidoglycan-binding domain-containing protein [Neolewinella sp.]|uniref:LysM peptidoglycan-binding domain-containing protein n=1 Tax=Neolewinella sp. TaxID=2993543 RepID=UPI003B524D4B
MSVKEKYRSVLEMGEKMNPRDGYVEEADGVLRMGSTVDTQYQKDQLWDEIKRVGGENPRDVEVDIKVANKSYYAKHTVQKGESLSKIAKEYLGDAMAYKKIFAANSDTLDDPNKIFPGQELTIPFPDGRSA